MTFSPDVGAETLQWSTSILHLRYMQLQELLCINIKIESLDPLHCPGSFSLTISKSFEFYPTKWFDHV